MTGKKRQKTPLVTIITPTYNQEIYLTETIESVLEQKYPLLEYIVLDDGSIDNTAQILRKYGNQIIWDKHANMGEALTVNKGFCRANGDIICVVNSDDPLYPNAINEIVELMVAFPEIGVVYPDWDMIDASGEIILHRETLEFNYLNMLRWHYCMPGPGTFFRKEVINIINGRDPQFIYVGDFDFWLRAGLYTKFTRIPKTLARFRRHPTSASSMQGNVGRAEEHIRVINKLYSLPNVTKEMLSIKNESDSSAYYYAGRVCKSCKLSKKRYYFFYALKLCPHKYLKEYKKRLTRTILPETFPFIRLIWVIFKYPFKIIKLLLERLIKAKMII